MRTPRRTRALLGIVATAVAAAGLVAGAPGAQAKAGPVSATWKLPVGSYALGVGLNAVWALNHDESHNSPLLRLDPTTHALKSVANLPFPAGNFDIAYGSLWITDYFGNAVWRLAPNGHVQAEIAVGLQPESVHDAFGSLWVSNHHGASLSRVDPATNTVIDTLQVGMPDTFRNGPQDVTDDGALLYVGSSNLQALQSVNPSTDAVTTPPSLDDAFCGPIHAISGYVWSVDACSGATYQLATDGSVAQVFPSTGLPLSLTTAPGAVWVGDDTTADPNTGVGSNAVLEQRDPVTGALERSVAIGGDVTSLASGYGSFWVYDQVANLLKRVDI